MDIRSNLPYPSCELSNFAAREFVVDGERCASMEGFVQSLKHRDPQAARAARALSGMAAKRAGEPRNGAWRAEQVLWWKGAPMPRAGPELALLVDMAFEAMHAQCESFRQALAAAGDEPLTHRIGGSDPAKTALTEEELCSRLECLRAFGRARRPRPAAPG